METLVRRVVFAVRLSFKLLLYGCSHLVPRNETTWVFASGHGNTFTGNTKYLFLYANRQPDEVRPIWIDRDEQVVSLLREEGYEAYHGGTLVGKYFLLRAAFCFLSHDVVFWPYSGGCTIVQLWHGNALKKMGWDKADRLPLAERLFNKYVMFDWDRFLVTGSGTPAETFMSAFDLGREQLLVGGYPRNDGLFGAFEGEKTDTSADDEAVERRYERIERLHKRATVIAYTPTWRRAFEESDGRAITGARLGLRRLDELLRAENAYLLCKYHPQSTVDIDTDSLDRIIVLPSEFDIHPALKNVDMLITDYSSLLFDYLLLDRPILFYPFDRASYETTRGFYFEYDDVTPGPTATTPDELHECIAQFLGGHDGFADARSEVRRTFYAHTDGNASRRVYETIRRQSG